MLFLFSTEINQVFTLNYCYAKKGIWNILSLLINLLIRKGIKFSGKDFFLLTVL